MSNAALNASLNNVFTIRPAMTPERKAVLERVDARLKEIHRDWRWIERELRESAQTINNWRRIRGLPSAKQPDVAKLLGWTVEELLGKEPDSESSWPFRNIPAYRLERLTPGQRLQAEGALLDELERLEGGRPEKYRPAATEPSKQQQSKPARNRKAAP